MQIFILSKDYSSNLTASPFASKAPQLVNVIFGPLYLTKITALAPFFAASSLSLLLASSLVGSGLSAVHLLNLTLIFPITSEG